MFTQVKVIHICDVQYEIMQYLLILKVLVITHDFLMLNCIFILSNC